MYLYNLDLTSVLEYYFLLVVGFVFNFLMFNLNLVYDEYDCVERIIHLI